MKLLFIFLSINKIAYAQSDTIMEEQKDIVSSLENFENTEKTVAYFYV